MKIKISLHHDTKEKKMDKASSESSFRIVPNQESRCVWMTAGVLSYQLCDRNFECETCMLDTALRKEQVKAHTHKSQADARAHLPGYTAKLNPDMLYSPGHYWVRTIHDQYLRIGFEPAIADVLHPLRGIVLPSCGQSVATDTPAGWILFSHGTLPINSPVDGRIVAVNTTLLSDPRLLSSNPSDQGWIFELIPCAPDQYRETLLDAKHADSAYRKDIREFHDTLTAMLHEHSPSVGPTLMDGGKPLDNISEILGPEKFLEAIKRVFIKKS